MSVELTPEVLDGIEVTAKECAEIGLCDLDVGHILALVAAARERDELRAEVERWTEKAQEDGAAYGLANSKHHAELERANRLERELITETDAYDHIITKQGKLLTGVANALNGPPPELATWSHHDLPELAEAVVKERDELRATLARVEAMHVADPMIADEYTYCRECSEPWPCDTTKALRGEDQ